MTFGLICVDFLKNYARWRHVRIVFIFPRHLFTLTMCYYIDLVLIAVIRNCADCAFLISGTVLKRL